MGASVVEILSYSESGFSEVGTRPLGTLITLGNMIPSEFHDLMFSMRFAMILSFKLTFRIMFFHQYELDFIANWADLMEHISMVRERIFM